MELLIQEVFCRIRPMIGIVMEASLRFVMCAGRRRQIK